MYEMIPGYYREAYQDIFAMVRQCVRELRSPCRNIAFDTIAVTGISGMLIGPTLAAVTRTNLVVIPKTDNESSHRNNGPVGVIGSRWIFVDDFICSGETRRRVREAIHKVCPDAIEVGTLEYNSSWSSPSFTPVRPC